MDEGQVKKQMHEVLDLVASDIATVRTGKATPGLVEDLKVAVYGGQQKLMINELANITSQDAQTIVIDPWDKSIIGELRKGIEAANIGLTPSIDGEIIRISVPPMTSEDRAKYVKLLKTKVESGKVMIRQIRQEIMRDIKSSFEDKKLSEDEKFNQEKRLQEVTDDFNKKIEDIGEVKEKELLSV